MKKNMGGIDKAVRVLLALILIILWGTGAVAGTLGYVLLGAAGIFLLTSVVSICPLYSILGINTCKVS